MWEKSKYISLGKGLDVWVMKFSGGELQVRLGEPQKPIGNHIPFAFDVTAYLTSSDAIMELLLVADALSHFGASIGTLRIPYFPYARQDRVCASGEAISVAVMARLINSLKYYELVVYDPHSDVTPALLNRVRILTQCNMLLKSKIKFSAIDYIVAPDAGAEKKARECAREMGVPLITATKRRDTITGQILATNLHLDEPDMLKDKRVLIVDDICDGGMTFVELASALKKHGVKRVDLFVTHGIFSRGFGVFDGLISSIYYSNSLGQMANLPADSILEMVNDFED